MSDNPYEPSRTSANAISTKHKQNGIPWLGMVQHRCQRCTTQLRRRHLPWLSSQWVQCPHCSATYSWDRSRRTLAATDAFALAFTCGAFVLSLIAIRYFGSIPVPVPHSFFRGISLFPLLTWASVSQSQFIPRRLAQLVERRRLTASPLDVLPSPKSNDSRLADTVSVGGCPLCAAKLRRYDYLITGGLRGEMWSCLNCDSLLTVYPLQRAIPLILTLMWTTTLEIFLLGSPTIGRSDVVMLMLGATILGMQIALMLRNKVSYVDKFDRPEYCTK